jgi:membrane fusion protein (multidrug efflux system)
VALRTLKVDRAIGSQWLVTAGLTPGDQLIMEGLQKVRPGTVVKTVPFRDPAPAAAPAN